MEEISKRISQRLSLQLKTLPLLVGLQSPPSPLAVITYPPKMDTTVEGVPAEKEAPLDLPEPRKSPLLSASPQNARRASSPALPDIALSAPDQYHLPPVSVPASPTAPPRVRHRDTDRAKSPSPSPGNDKDSPGKIGDFVASYSTASPSAVSIAFEKKEEGASQSGSFDNSQEVPSGANSREGSVERPLTPLISPQGASAEEVSLGSASSTKSSEEGKEKSSGGSNGTAGGGEKKQQQTPSSLVVRHNSDASSIASSAGKSGKSSDKKRQQRWYQSLYPTYKQRSEEFRRLFPSIPEGERLLIDYSCALQRDILVQGRLYASQNHICFYAKIIAWETNICTSWKNVRALNKERTAKIIPNAISYATDQEQYYFTSFGQRDKTFTNLYRIWQGAVKNQPMSPPEMWSFIHYQYGDDLGLTSDDEDYVQPAYLRSLPELISAVNGAAEAEAQAAQHQQEGGGGEFPLPNGAVDKKLETEMMDAGPVFSVGPCGPPELVRNRSGSVGSGSSRSSSSGASAEGEEAQQQPVFIPPVPSGAQGFIDHEFHVPFDKLFLVLFSESTLLKEMFLRRKIFDTKFGQWVLDPSNDCQVRDVKYCISVGPKTIRTEERQTLLKESVPGRLHLVDSVAQNHGAPYSDSFSVVTHYMVHKLDSKNSRLRVVTEIVFRKANWAVKALLEKGVMDQLRDYFSDLKSRLVTYEAELATAGHEEIPGSTSDATLRVGRSRTGSHHGEGEETTAGGAASAVPGSPHSLLRHRSRTSVHHVAADGLPEGTAGTFFVTQLEYGKVKKLVYLIIVLLLINALLYWRVWEGQDSAPSAPLPPPAPAACPPGPMPGFERMTPREGVGEQEWMELLRASMTDTGNAHLLKDVNEGLGSVLSGLRKISTALETLQISLIKTGAASQTDNVIPSPGE
ncbi:protein Aster-B-like isoform X2 [Paramacrobiotus metropolitanus]|uniref:protein Aster-B-like isoform X2 n=1 Tax=Paramacrobiotus metropolitanus TaxID=2943436 RepID=UPI00244577E5|nr:protein Aster-B-like isoform X2 [Paramacrobiotus metropolitanus]